jgi:hypothetical protein
MLGQAIAKANALRCVENATMLESVKLQPLDHWHIKYLQPNISYIF